jgi:hypothetical protein
MPKREGLQTVENQDTVKARQPWWLVLCFATVGVGCDWYCAFRWSSGRYSLCSGIVLLRMGLIVGLCAAVAFLAVCVVRGARLRDAAAVFFLASITLCGNILIWWDVHR